MPNTTIKSADKVKLIDQMLEDLAGDEFDELDSPENDTKAGFKRFSTERELDLIDLMH